jgi:kinetochore protein Mis13/DSN1
MLFPAQLHSSVNNTSLYKHIDSELPDPAQQSILLCAARAPLPAPREGKDPPSEKGAKLFQDVKDDLLILLAERKIDMNVMPNEQPGSAANRGLEVRANEQSVNNRGRTTRLKDQIHSCVSNLIAFPASLSLFECQGKGCG